MAVVLLDETFKPLELKGLYIFYLIYKFTTIFHNPTSATISSGNHAQLPAAQDFPACEISLISWVSDSDAFEHLISRKEQDHGKTKRRRPLAIKAEFSGTIIKKGSGEISSSGKSHGIGRNTSSYYKKSSSSSSFRWFVFSLWRWLSGLLKL